MINLTKRCPACGEVFHSPGYRCEACTEAPQDFIAKPQLGLREGSVPIVIDPFETRMPIDRSLEKKG